MIASSSWWPQPRTTQERQANCEWLARRCRHCGRHEASLFARQPIEQGEELTVPRSLAPHAGAAPVPYEVFFDGGTCTRGHLCSRRRCTSLSHPQPRPTHMHCQSHLSHPWSQLCFSRRVTRMRPCAAYPDRPRKRTLGIAWQHSESSVCWRLQSGHSLRGGSGAISVR